MSWAGSACEQLSLRPLWEGGGGTLAGKGLVTDFGPSPPWGDTDMSQEDTEPCPARPKVPRVLKTVIASKQAFPRDVPQAASLLQPSVSPQLCPL